MRVVARKFRSDEHGEQIELDLADYIDVGALDDAGRAVALERRKLRKGASEIELAVHQKPAKVGIDPLHKLIDRRSDDNVVVPESESQERTSRMRIHPRLAIVALVLWTLGGCPEGKTARPGAPCAKAYDKCVLESGVLGLCDPVECKPEQSAPCFVCRSQH